MIALWINDVILTLQMKIDLVWNWQQKGIFQFRRGTNIAFWYHFDTASENRSCTNDIFKKDTAFKTQKRRLV